jgi:hypothetical protein
MVCDCGGKPKLAAITFNGEGCARSEYPGLYERVDPVRVWIYKTLYNTNKN